jgi:hypothetical protein
MDYLIKIKFTQAMVHVCNPSYSGGKNRGIMAKTNYRTG